MKVSLPLTWTMLDSLLPNIRVHSETHSLFHNLTIQKYLFPEFGAAPSHDATPQLNDRSGTESYCILQNTTEFAFVIDKDLKEIVASSSAQVTLLQLVRLDRLQSQVLHNHLLVVSLVVRYGIHKDSNQHLNKNTELLQLETLFLRLETLLLSVKITLVIVTMVAHFDHGSDPWFQTHVLGCRTSVGGSVDFVSRTIGTTLSNQSGTGNGFATWRFAENFDQQLPDTSFGAELSGSTNDLVHTIVVDEDGLWTGTKGTVLERFSGRSKATNAKDEQGRNLFYVDSDQ